MQLRFSVPYSNIGSDFTTYTVHRQVFVEQEKTEARKTYIYQVLEKQRVCPNVGFDFCWLIGE